MPLTSSTEAEERQPDAVQGNNTPSTTNGAPSKTASDDVNEVLRSVATQLRRVQAERSTAYLSHIYSTKTENKNINSRVQTVQVNGNTSTSRHADPFNWDNEAGQAADVLRDDSSEEKADAQMNSKTKSVSITLPVNSEQSPSSAAACTNDTEQEVVWQLDVSDALQQYTQSIHYYSTNGRPAGLSISNASRNAQRASFAFTPITRSHPQGEDITNNTTISQHSPCVILSNVSSIDTQYTDACVTRFAQAVLRALLHHITNNSSFDKSSHALHKPERYAQANTSVGSCTVNVYHVFGSAATGSVDTVTGGNTLSSNDTCKDTSCSVTEPQCLPWCYLAWRQAWERATHTLLTLRSRNHDTTNTRRFAGSGIIVQDFYVMSCKDWLSETSTQVKLPNGQAVRPVPPLWGFLYDRLASNNTTTSHTKDDSDALHTSHSARQKAMKSKLCSSRLPQRCSVSNSQDTDTCNNGSVVCELLALQGDALARLPLTRGTSKGGVVTNVVSSHSDPYKRPMSAKQEDPLQTVTSSVMSTDYVSLAQECLRMTHDAMGEVYRGISDAVAAELVPCPLRLYTLTELSGSITENTTNKVEEEGVCVIHTAKAL